MTRNTKAGRHETPKPDRGGLVNGRGRGEVNIGPKAPSVRLRRFVAAGFRIARHPGGGSSPSLNAIAGLLVRDADYPSMWRSPAIPRAACLPPKPSGGSPLRRPS